MELYQQGGFVALVTYLLMIKLKKKVSKKYLPVVSICLACTLAGTISYLFGADWHQTVISGLAGGASSMGFHDTIKSMKRNKE